MKKILNLLGIISLAVFIGFSLTACPLFLNEDKRFTYEETPTEIIITGYTGTRTSLEIPRQINGKPVTTIGSQAFRAHRLSSVTIPDSVTTIEFLAFANCKLKAITIPNSVTHIGSTAFWGNELTAVTLPNNITYISSDAFAFNQLSSIIIPDSVKEIEWRAFHGNQLISITIGENVTVNGHAFAHYIEGDIDITSIGFDITYNDNGRTAGTYTRNNTSTTIWSKPSTAVPTTITINGIAKVGEKITAVTNNGYTDSYQWWYADTADAIEWHRAYWSCCNINGNEFIAGSGMKDKFIKVSRNQSNIQSNIIGPIQSSITISGTAMVGERLIATSNDDDYIGDYRWLSAYSSDPYTRYYVAEHYSSGPNKSILNIGNDLTGMYIWAYRGTTSYVSNYSNALGPVHAALCYHDWQWVVTTSPTCTVAGVETEICSHDAIHTRDTQPIPALGHDWRWIQTKTPTDTEDGEEIGFCSNNCGLFEVRTILKFKIIVPGNNLVTKLQWVNTNAVSNRSYILDVTANETIVPQTLSFTDRSDVTVILKGFNSERIISLSDNGSLFTIATGVILVLDENITLRGHNENNRSLVTINNGGTLIMNNGSKIISNRNADIRNTTGVSTVNSRSYGGGVYNSGTFTMNGGEISGNIAFASASGVSTGSAVSVTAISNGGGVYNDGTFTMNGGIISNNTVSAIGNSSGPVGFHMVSVLNSYGGGVYNNRTFIMYDGEISGNTASANISGRNRGGGVDGGVTLHGGVIINNTPNNY
ncbi:MAG: leucine-rich repeat protein [Treponema sp.]|nr:leucine-rich repeat protein [Treponema sp.]